LGVPWVWISRGQRRGYLEEQEKKYALGFNVKTPEEAIKKVGWLMAGKNAGWLAKKERLLEEKIDVTEWAVDRIMEECRS
jgi:predicted glycosyltransferase